MCDLLGKVALPFISWSHGFDTVVINSVRGIGQQKNVSHLCGVDWFVFNRIVEEEES